MWRVIAMGGREARIIDMLADDIDASGNSDYPV